MPVPTFMIEHPAVVALAAYWVFSAIVGGMVPPKAESGVGYTWLYNSLHLLAGNISAAVAAKYPNGLPPGSVQVTTTQAKTVTATPPTEAPTEPKP